ncbi:unnamed protein product, partial [Rotaria sordida]
MLICNRWNIFTQPEIKEYSTTVNYFLSTFDLNIHHISSKKIYIIDYPDDEKVMKCVEIIEQAM